MHYIKLLEVSMFDILSQLMEHFLDLDEGEDGSEAQG